LTLSYEALLLIYLKRKNLVGRRPYFLASLVQG